MQLQMQMRRQKLQQLLCKSNAFLTIQLYLFVPPKENKGATSWIILFHINSLLGILLSSLSREELVFLFFLCFLQEPSERFWECIYQGEALTAKRKSKLNQGQEEEERSSFSPQTDTESSRGTRAGPVLSVDGDGEQRVFGTTSRNN